MSTGGRLGKRCSVDEGRDENTPAKEGRYDLGGKTPGGVPIEILTRILSYLTNLRDMANVEMVNSTLKEYAREDCRELEIQDIGDKDHLYLEGRLKFYVSERSS